MLFHICFKENDNYKVKMFFSKEAIYRKETLSEYVENIISDYEKEHNCCLGDTKQLKLIRIPKEYLNKRGVMVREDIIEDENVISDLKQHKNLTFIKDNYII